MGKKDNLSRDQKRKAKLARDKERNRPQASLAYTGQRWKTDEFVPVIFWTERAIHEIDVVLDERLTDRAVRAALEELVLDMRRGPLPALDPNGRLEIKPGQEKDLAIENIRRSWKLMAEEIPHPGKDNLIGVLRTLLGSIDVWSSPSPGSRGYLQFLKGFMKKNGVVVRKLPAETSQQQLSPPDEDALVTLGRAWCFKGDMTAAEVFRRQCQAGIAAGEGDRVMEACQLLVGEIGDRNHPAFRELSVLSGEAERALTRDSR